jgi:hypothetical protein
MNQSLSRDVSATCSVSDHCNLTEHPDRGPIFNIHRANTQDVLFKVVLLGMRRALIFSR